MTFDPSSGEWRGFWDAGPTVAFSRIQLVKVLLWLLCVGKVVLMPDLLLQKETSCKVWSSWKLVVSTG